MITDETMTTRAETPRYGFQHITVHYRDPEACRDVTDKVPCPEALQWARQYPTLQAAWNACERGDWMLWYLGRCGVDRRRLVAAAVDCARTVEHLAPPAVRVCNETTARWTVGRATVDDVQRARYAIYAAAYDFDAYADAYAYAATAAAHAATTAAHAATTEYADAATAAAHAATTATADAAAAYADAYAYAATTEYADAAGEAKRRECAAIIRRHFPYVALPSTKPQAKGT